MLFFICFSKMWPISFWCATIKSVTFCLCALVMDKIFFSAMCRWWWREDWWVHCVSRLEILYKYISHIIILHRTMHYKLMLIYYIDIHSNVYNYESIMLWKLSLMLAMHKHYASKIKIMLKSSCDCDSLTSGCSYLYFTSVMTNNKFQVVLM